MEPLLRLLNTTTIFANGKPTARRILDTTSLAGAAFRKTALTRLDALVILAGAGAALAAAVGLAGAAAQPVGVDLVVVAAQPGREAVAGAQQARVGRTAYVAAHVRLRAARVPAQAHVAAAARPAAVRAAAVARRVARLAGGAADRITGAAHLRCGAAEAGGAGLVGRAADIEAAGRGVLVAAQIEPAREAHLGGAAAAAEDAAAPVLAAVGARLARRLRVVVRVRHPRDAAAALPRQEQRPAYEAAPRVAGSCGRVRARLAREAGAVVEVGRVRHRLRPVQRRALPWYDHAGVAAGGRRRYAMRVCLWELVLDNLDQSGCVCFWMKHRRRLSISEGHGDIALA